MRLMRVGRRPRPTQENQSKTPIWVEAVRYNEMFVRLGSRGRTMRCSGVPGRHGTPEHLIV